MAVIIWSMSGYSTSGYGDYWIRACIGGSCGGDVNVYTNEGGSHKTWSGSWATSVNAGTVTVKLQVKKEGGGTFMTDSNDHVSWTLLVLRGTGG